MRGRPCCARSEPLLDASGDLRSGQQRLLRAALEEPGALRHRHPHRSQGGAASTGPAFARDLVVGRLAGPDQRPDRPQGRRARHRRPRGRRSLPWPRPAVRRQRPGRSPRRICASGIAHAPEPRVIDAYTADGVELLLAGHTHGGQVCLPGFGPIVTNCGIDRARARGLSRYGSAGNEAWLHVSAGIGTSPYAPIRFACRPEATLLTLDRDCPLDFQRVAGVAQLGSALRSGRRGRRFKSCHPDQSRDLRGRHREFTGDRPSLASRPASMASIHRSLPSLA